MDIEKWSAAAANITRPLVTLGLIGTLCYLVIMGVKPDDIDYKDFVNLVMIAVLFWFKSRDDERKTEQAIETIKATANNPPAPIAPIPPTEPAPTQGRVF
jgi:hypothetical protein